MNNSVLKNGLIAGGTALVCLTLVFTVSHFTHARIQADKIKAENARFAQLLPAGSFDNNLNEECHMFTLPDGRDVRILTARLGNKPTGYIASYDVLGGYAMPFKMTAGITLPDYSIHYMDVDVFNETPGLGDKILRNHSGFLDSFTGANLTNRKWEVKKYGGDFDYYTGATVTPRAVTRSTGSLIEALAKAGIDAIASAPVCANLAADSNPAGEKANEANEKDSTNNAKDDARQSPKEYGNE